MLAANVGFLAIQGVVVVPSDGGWIKASPSQIASSMSLVFSIGSIITGLLLIRRNRTMAMQDPGAAVRCSFHTKRFLVNRLLVRLPGGHGEALLSPGALGHHIQPNVCSIDVVVRRHIPGPCSPDSDMTNLFSVCVFFVALLLFSFQDMKTDIRVSLGAASGIVTILITWCIINSWDSSISDSESDKLIDVLPVDEGLRAYNSNS